MGKKENLEDAREHNPGGNGSTQEMLQKREGNEKTANRRTRDPALL